jgi:hypothetical protein
MMRSRSASVMADQPAISSRDRRHPAHSPVLASITHTLIHGVSIGLSKSAGVGYWPARPRNVGSGRADGNVAYLIAVDSTLLRGSLATA